MPEAELKEEIVKMLNDFTWRRREAAGVTEDGRSPAGVIARLMELSTGLVRDALAELVTEDRVGEEPPGYFWTDPETNPFAEEEPPSGGIEQTISPPIPSLPTTPGIGGLAANAVNE